MLDGPLGGMLPVACEVASVPLLAILCKGIPRNALIVSLMTVALAAWVGYRNRLALAGDAITDGLFVFAHVAELMSAFAYLFRSVLLGASGANVAARFGHLMMPMQQVLSAYYFVQAFEAAPQLVGAGRPFDVLQVGGIVQLGVFAGAAVLHLAEHLEISMEEADELEEEEVLAAPSPTPQPHSEVFTDSSENAMSWAPAVQAVPLSPAF
jgi:hypothetical protein